MPRTPTLRRLSLRLTPVHFVLGVGLLLALCLPGRVEAQRSYTVRAGDTLVRIARRHRVSVADLQRANRMRNASVRVGQRLRIPGGAGWRQAPRARRYRVRAGDTLARIARRHGTRIEEIQAANGMRNTNIRPGQVLTVPRRGQSGAAVRAQQRAGNAATVANDAPDVDAEEQAAIEARVQELHIGSLASGQRVLREAPPSEWVAAAGTPEDVEGTLLLPVDGGAFRRGWGSGLDGYHLAVDIGARTGTDVRAVERGLVVYAGNRIRGYGNMVILVHPNGWVTGYAHHQRNAVVAGQIVQRGERIGAVGQTGFARGPHLHFIFAFEGEHCDPTPMFQPRIRRSNGNLVDEPEVVWDTEHRPSGIRCLARSARPHPHYQRGRSRRGRRR
ncbi:MAG: LysM peptidoglycan-binding domain-containing protein [Sandaracinaceae bacterium]